MILRFSSFLLSKEPRSAMPQDIGLVSCLVPIPTNTVTLVLSQTKLTVYSKKIPVV